MIKFALENAESFYECKTVHLCLYDFSGMGEERGIYNLKIQFVFPEGVVFLTTLAEKVKEQ